MEDVEPPSASLADERNGLTAHLGEEVRLAVTPKWF
jgi:hypothetical protein